MRKNYSYFELRNSANTSLWYEFARDVLVKHWGNYYIELIQDQITDNDTISFFKNDFTDWLTAFEMDYLYGHTSDAKEHIDYCDTDSREQYYEYREHFEVWFEVLTIDGLYLSDYINLNAFDDYKGFFEHRKEEIEVLQSELIYKYGEEENTKKKRDILDKIIIREEQIQSIAIIIEIYRLLCVEKDYDKALDLWINSKRRCRKGFIDNLNLLKSMIRSDYFLKYYYI